MLELKAEALVIAAALAGLQTQATGLAEAADLDPVPRPLAPRAPWRFIPPRLWPAPLAAVDLHDAPSGIVIGCGGMAAVVGAALRRPDRPVVQVQHPRMDPARFDLVVVNPHDRLSGPNVLVARTALHRVTQVRLREAAAAWAPRLAHLPRPLVAVLVGGSNGRHRFGPPDAARLGADLAAMMRRDRVGLALTPSRRTGAEAQAALAAALAPAGAWLWDGAGENPYFGLLAMADAIVVTEDSVSMVSEAVATAAPVLLAPLPGRSRRIAAFTDGLVAAGRVRPFAGRFETWPAEPLDDTPAIGAEVRRRLGL